MSAFDRRRLLRHAYRMLGSVADAEDIVQDAYLRWQAAPREAVADPAAYQVRIVTRLCLDHLRSARVRRERYVGAWLPEPLVEAEGFDGGVETADDVGVALMLALERLSPLERAALLLHDVFDMDFAAIGEVLQRSDVACRRLAARARAHLAEARPRFAVEPEAEAALARAFRAASTEGDVAALQDLLAADCVLVSDGGGKRPAAINPIVGAARIARFFEGLHGKFGYRGTGQVEIVRINGLPGYVTLEVNDVLQTTALDIADGRVRAIYVVRNPDKLGHVAEPATRAGRGDSSLAVVGLS